MKTISLMFSMIALIALILFARILQPVGFATEIVSAIVYTIAVFSLFAKVLYDTFQVVRNRNNGLFFGVAFSTIISTTFVSILYLRLSLDYTNMEYIVLGLVIFFLLSFYNLFTLGFMTIKAMHRGQAFFLGEPLEKVEFKHGPAWWFPKFLGGGFQEFYMENRTMELYNDGTSLAVSHGMKFKKSPMSLVYKYLDGKLVQIMQMGTNLESDFKEFVLDRIRNAAILIGATISKEDLDAKYSGLILLLIMDSIKLLKRLVLNGAYFESHHIALELLRDELYLKRVFKAYKDIFGVSASKEEMLAWFTPEVADEQKLPVFSDAQWKTVLQTKDADNMPQRGVYREAYENGFEVVKFTIDSPVLEDELADEVNARRYESIQKEKELQNVATFKKLCAEIREELPGLSDSEIANRALIQQGVEDIKLREDAIKLIGDGSDMSKLIAGLRAAAQGINQGGSNE